MTTTGTNPLVSVCIQTYQHAAFIGQCIDSAVQQQTKFPFEIILGEDESTDGTREICQSYAAKYPELIRLFLRSDKDKIFINGEKTGRFNFIENLRAAKGKYIALLDGDDYWCDLRKLQKQVDFMEAHPKCTTSFHNAFRCVENGASFINKSDTLSESNTVFDFSFLLQSERNPFLTSSNLFLSQNIREIPAMFYQVPFLDHTLHIHNALGGKIGFLADRMSVYRLHTGGMWSAARAPRNTIRLWRLYSLLSQHPDERVREAFMERRLNTGHELIAFYKKHLWKDRRWLKEEVSAGKFKSDEALLHSLNAKPLFRNYLASIRNYGKEIARKLSGRK